MVFTADRLPTGIDEFRAMAESRMTSPEDVCGLFFMALNLYVSDKDAGIEAMNILRGPRPMNGFDVQFLRDRLRGKEYLPLAYFKGASPENGYTTKKTYVLEIIPDTQPQDEGYLKVFIKTTGADSPRPMKLRTKPSTGQWFLWEYSSILSGIRIPASQDPWA